MAQVEKKLGVNVARYRKAAGKTQAELADRVGVSLETISRLERGAAVPGLVRIEAIARALHVDLADLFRFRQAESGKDKALDDIVELLRPRTEDEIVMIRDLAARVFRA